MWKSREKGGFITISLILNVSHLATKELLCLCLLLHNVRGTTSFEDLRSVRHTVHRTYKLACMDLLLDRDDIYQVTTYETARWRVPGRLRVLITHILFHCNIADPQAMYNNINPYILDATGDDLEASKNRALMISSSAWVSSINLLLITGSISKCDGCRCCRVVLFSLQIISMRAILFPRNEDVDDINAIMVARLGGDRRRFLSHGQLEDSSKDSMNVRIKYLKSLTVSSLPPHYSNLAVGSGITLIRNIDTKHGLCNGTRSSPALTRARGPEFHGLICCILRLASLSPSVGDSFLSVWHSPLPSIRAKAYTLINLYSAMRSFRWILSSEDLRLFLGSGKTVFCHHLAREHKNQKVTLNFVYPEMRH
ncbi:hypothetical protein PR048_010326 [Dryococelus australis]|uniref:DNA helicase Pif1-like 2B domain-containing protein n=1 Tax=Dryococelus australis TaxID=614101 RepID=A0ABQ9I2I7_9NEOP|nr:hypothetical protein PR048_010326 [Dryococelus australis]